MTTFSTTTTQPHATQADANGATAFDWLLMLGPGLIWGASFRFIAKGLPSIGHAAITFVRIAVGFGTTTASGDSSQQARSRHDVDRKSTSLGAELN